MTISTLDRRLADALHAAERPDATIDRAALADLLRDLRAERAGHDRVVAGYRREIWGADQALGKALCYPEAYPHVSEVDDGSVVTGEHTVSTIAQEAAELIADLRAAILAKPEGAPVVPALATILADFQWQARRYVDRRFSYAVNTFNGHTRALLLLGLRLNATGDGTIWARDGYRYWPGAERGFTDGLDEAEAALGCAPDESRPYRWLEEEVANQRDQLLLAYGALATALARQGGG